MAKPRDLALLRTEVADMRQKLRQHHGEQSTEVKHASGGIVDLEFISQYLVLAHGCQQPALYQYSDNIRILEAAAAVGLMSVSEAQALQQAYQDLRGISHRLTLEPAAETVLPDVSAAMLQVQASWRQVFAVSPADPDSAVGS